jgi:hypothetical protein
MVESFHVAGFKLFRDIALPKLGRLNLLVGENNTGKSCLLEALSLYAGRSPAADVLGIAADRMGVKLSPWDGIYDEGTSLIHPVFELFHRTGSESVKRIRIEKIGDSRPLRLEQRLYRLVKGDGGLLYYEPALPGHTTEYGAEIAFEIYRGGDPLVGLVTSRSVEARGRALEGERVSNGYAPTVFLPARGFSEEKAALMWDALVQGPGQDLVLHWLRMLDPRIEDLAYIGGSSGTRLPLLKMQGQSRIPLRSMGDGLTRMFHIALAAGSASSGVLLIDEFENGLHWSVQEKLWETIARAAASSNVQVFCTTHSRDCVQGFTAAAAGSDVDAFIYRFERKGDDVFANELPLLNVGAAMRQHAEVR